MSGPGMVVSTPEGEVTLRPETADDAPFLAALFSARAAAILRPAGLAEPQVQQLVAMQHRAQTASYRTAYPHARFLVVERDGASIGRLVQADEPGGAYVVDIALLPERRRRGVGAALIADLQRRQGALGGRVRADIAVENAASLAMFAKLGFVQTDTDSVTDIHVVWTLPEG